MLITSVVSRATLQRLLSCMLFCCICATSAQAAIDNPGVIPDDRLTHPQDGPDTVARNFGLWDDTETGGRTTFETLDFRKNGHRGQYYSSCAGYPIYHPQHVVRLPNKDGRAYFMAANSFATDNKITINGITLIVDRVPSGYLSLYRSDSVVDPLTDLVPNSPGTDGEIIWEDIYDSNWPYKSDAEGWNHPGQMQVIGGLLLVSMEQWYDNSIGLYRTLYCDDYGDGAGLDTVFFYDVRDPENPVYWGKLDKNELGVTGSVNRVHLFKAKDQWVLVVGDRVFTASEVSPQISAGGGPGFTFWGVNVDDFLFQTHGGLFYSYEDYDPISSLPSPSVPSPGEKRAMYFDGVEDKDNYVVGDEVLKFANICFDPQWYVQCQFEPTPPPPDPSLARISSVAIRTTTQPASTSAGVCRSSMRRSSVNRTTAPPPTRSTRSIILRISI